MIKSYISLCNNLISLSCEFLKIKIPDIYYIEKDKENFILTDSNDNFVSSDFRDCGYEISTISFIPSEYVIYINKTLFSDDKELIYTLILRKIRAIYQLNQIKKFLRNQQTYEKVFIIKQWIYCYRLNNKKYNINSPCEVDKNIFSMLLIKIIFEINIRYDITNNEAYSNKEFELRNQIDSGEIRRLMKKYGFR